MIALPESSLMEKPEAPRGVETLAVALRSPDVVMRLDRLGSFHQTRLSFMRVLLRRLDREGWRLSRVRWDVDARGEGVAVYRAAGPERPWRYDADAWTYRPRTRSRYACGASPKRRLKAREK